LLDTSAIITLQRNNEALKKLLSTATEVFVPVVAVGELYYGAYKSQRVEENRQNVAAFIFKPFLIVYPIRRKTCQKPLALAIQHQHKMVNLGW
jgi:predicted nucleic acid-binding protein